MPQLFHITDEQGQFIMNAPLETLECIFALSAVRVAKLLQRTSKQNAEYVFFSGWQKWPTLRVRRLPLEIPRPEGALFQPQAE